MSIYPADNLPCENLNNLLGVAVSSPRFSWLVHHNVRNQAQAAYQIRMAQDYDDLTNNAEQIWGSGKVESEYFSHIAYAGKRLVSFTRYYWCVR